MIDAPAARTALAIRARDIGHSAVPFGRSSERDRREWVEEMYAADDAAASAYRQRASEAGDTAYAYAWGWIDGQRDRLSPDAHERAAELALAYMSEYARQGWLFATRKTSAKRGYALWWGDIVRAHGLTPDA